MIYHLTLSCDYDRKHYIFSESRFSMISFVQTMRCVISIIKKGCNGLPIEKANNNLLLDTRTELQTNYSFIMFKNDGCSKLETTKG